MLSLLPSLVVLGLAAAVAGLLTVRRPSPPARAAARVAAANTLLTTTLVQAVHFTEEAVTGFHIRFPALFDLPPMPYWFFMGFNLGWLYLWLLAFSRLRAARRWAFFTAWFLALAGMLNGIAHPLFALRTGSYFPGLLSSPLIGAAGIWLWLRLRAATHSPVSRQ